MAKNKKNGARRLLKDYMHYKQRKFFRRWLNAFAPSLTEEQYENFIEEKYIWNVFTFNLLPAGSYSKGDDARSASIAAG